MNGGGVNVKVIITEKSELAEDTIIIHCHDLEVGRKIQQLLQPTKESVQPLFGMFEGKEYRINLKEILFFETDNDVVCAHTAKIQFELKERLYELEKILPEDFLRISKSAILNIPMLDSIEIGIAGPRMISFRDTDKIVYVSRKYYPQLKEKL